MPLTSIDSSTRSPRIIKSIDWITICLYLALLALGWMSVCGASYDFEQGYNFLDFSTRSGMQIVWMGTSLLLGCIILMTDDRLIESCSYFLYLFMLALLFITPFIARDIKGSLSWIKIGSFSIQPAEFAKFTTALCVAKVMNSYGFSMSRWRDFLLCLAIILTPMILIVMQKETGSALVYASFFLMLYREGMPGGILFAAVSAVVYFVVGVRFSEDVIWDGAPASLGTSLVLGLVHLFTVMLVRAYTPDRKAARNILWYGLLAEALALLFCRYVIPFDVTWVLLGVCGAMIVYLIWLAMRDQLMRYLYIALFAIGSLGFFYSANYVLEDVMQPHQQTRIRVLLGLEDDPRGAGYNSHRIGRTARQGLPQRHPDQAQVCARTGHRLHLLHGGRGGGLPWLCHRTVPLPGSHTASHPSGRAPALHLRARLWLLRNEHIPVPRLYQRGHGAGTHACHRHSPAILQLWRLFAVGLHHPALHHAPHRRRA